MPIDDVSSQPEINFLEHHIHIKVVAIHVYSMATFGRVYREPCIGNINGVTCLKTNYEKKQFTVPENIPTPPPWGAGGSVRPKNFKKCMKLNWNFQRGGGLTKNPLSGGGKDNFQNYTFVNKFEVDTTVSNLIY